MPTHLPRRFYNLASALLRFIIAENVFHSQFAPMPVDLPFDYASMTQRHCLRHSGLRRMALFFRDDT